MAIMEAEAVALWSTGSARVDIQRMARDTAPGVVFRRYHTDMTELSYWNLSQIRDIFYYANKSL